MELLLSILVSFSCFSTVLPSFGAQTVFCSVENTSGYLCCGSLSAGWGGVPHLVVYNLDWNGNITGQQTPSVTGEPVAGISYGTGAAVASFDRQNLILQITALDTSGDILWQEELANEFTGNIAVCTSGSGIVVAGNDQEYLRVVLLDNQGSVVWNSSFQETSFTVRDVSAFNGTFLVAGTCEMENWQSEIRLMTLESYGLNPQVYVLQPEQGRFSVEAAVFNQSGVSVLVNAMTDQNNMIYETQLIRLSNSMEIQWTGSVAGESWDRGTDMTMLPGGSTAVCGWTNSIPMSEVNRSDLMICSFSGTGEVEWVSNHHVERTDYGVSISAVSDGGYLVSGCTVEELYQGLVLKTDSLGSTEPYGISGVAVSGFSAGPVVNPVQTGNMGISVSAAQSGTVNITVYDTAGRIVTESESSVPSGTSVVYISTDIPPGMYSVRVVADQNESVFRSVVCGGIR